MNNPVNYVNQLRRPFFYYLWPVNWYMILIADSGSTKTTWSLVNPMNGSVDTIQTSGINPLYQDKATILALLKSEFILESAHEADIRFYGAGCINEHVNETVQSALLEFFNCTSLTVETDLMAAARSLCGRNEGIACILGTGSNSCYYDGQKIMQNISPLGFILGDEGSGAVIGKKLIADLLKNQLPESVKEKFFNTYDLKPHQIIERIYKMPFPNRFLAQFTRFISQNPDEPALLDLIKISFLEFFKRNVSQYPEAFRLPVHFTGGVAFAFAGLLKECAQQLGYRTGKITAAPMDDLISFHMDHIKQGK